MSSTVDSYRPRYAITDDGLLLHGSRFVRCGDSANLYILPESGKREISYLALQRSGRYWYITEFLMDDKGNVFASLYGTLDKTKYISISQAAKQLITLFEEEELFFRSLTKGN